MVEHYSAKIRLSPAVQETTFHVIVLKRKGKHTSTAQHITEQHKKAALATVLLLLDLVQTLGLAGATIYNILTQGYPQSSELCALPVETGSCCPNQGMQQGE